MADGRLREIETLRRQSKTSGIDNRHKCKHLADFRKIAVHSKEADRQAIRFLAQSVPQSHCVETVIVAEGIRRRALNRHDGHLSLTVAAGVQDFSCGIEHHCARFGNVHAFGDSRDKMLAEGHGESDD